MGWGLRPRQAGISTLPLKGLTKKLDNDTRSVYRCRMLTRDRLREVLEYNPSSGWFTWRKRIARCVHIGQTAGRFYKTGYVSITIDRKAYLAHRLAWLYMRGEWPTKDIDHKDRDRGNNAWNNLREADRSQNKVNAKDQNSVTGFRGVIKNGMRFIAVIRWKRRRYYLGSFATPEEAHRAYRDKAKELFGEFTT